jgi:hypothetical protein
MHTKPIQPPGNHTNPIELTVEGMCTYLSSPNHWIERVRVRSTGEFDITHTPIPGTNYSLDIGNLDAEVRRTIPIELTAPGDDESLKKYGEAFVPNSHSIGGIDSYFKSLCRPAKD